jgi:hypothetical protein
MFTAHISNSCNIHLSIIASSLVSTSTFWLQPVARSFSSSCKPTSRQFSHLHTLGFRNSGTWLRVQPPSTVPFRIVSEGSQCWEHPFKWHWSTAISTPCCQLQECDPSSASSLIHLWPLSSRRATGPAFLITHRPHPTSFKLEAERLTYFVNAAVSSTGMSCDCYWISYDLSLKFEQLQKFQTHVFLTFLIPG